MALGILELESRDEALVIKSALRSPSKVSKLDPKPYRFLTLRPKP